ncbi:MAG: endolytic transglycosylase MltG [Kordia sp.]|uniref:endolytic transglycosylase MltG n=1 Tax=Kordia sp. TaxID=1965332 RepID=UPI003858659D
MYLRKILIGILILGIIGGSYFIYNITQKIFKPITAFNNEEAYIYIPSGADFKYVKNELAPLLTDVDAFSTLAKKLGYKSRIKGGKYIIRKGMNSNDIVKTLLDPSQMITIELPASRELKLIREIAKDISAQIEASENEIYEVMVDTIYPKEKGYKLIELQDIYDENTYRIPWNTSAEEFRTIVFDRYQKKKLNQ